jgi:hypothetical protein
MACCPDHQKFGFKIACKIYDVPDGMTGHDVSLKLDTTLLGHSSRPLNDTMISARGSTSLFTDLFYEFGHIVDFFDRNHVKLRVVLLGYRNCEPQSMKRVFRAIIGVADYSARLAAGRSGVTGASSAV